MTNVHIIPGEFTITDPDWPRYEYSRSGEVLISDNFTRDGWLGGQDTDSALGGQTATWDNAQYVSQAWQVTGGQAVWNKTGTVFLPVDRQDYDIEVKVAALPTTAADEFNVQARRTTNTQQYVSAVIRGDGQLKIKHYGGTSIVETPYSSRRVAAGDVVALQVSGGNATVLLNGTPAVSTTTEVWNADRVALNSSSAAGAKLDYLRVIAR